MKTKNVAISLISFLSIMLFVMFMFSFINQQTVQYKAVASLDKIHFIYLNFENPVTVVVPGIPKEKVIVKCAEVAVKPLGDSKYSIPVMDPLLSNKKVHLSVSILNTAGKEQLIETLEYLVVSAPEPQPYFVNRTGGNATYEDLMSSDSIYVSIPGFYYEGFRYQVSRFFVVVLAKDGLSMTYPQQNGFMLTPEQKMCINNLKKGDKITFTNIYATYTDPITKKPANEIRISKDMDFTVE